MAEKLLDVCIDVMGTGFELELQPNEDCLNPVSGPYWFKYWFTQDDDNQGIEGDSLPLDHQTGRCRVLAWNEEPTTINVDFGAPLVLSKRVVLRMKGDGTIGNSDPTDPWPTI